MDKKVPSEEIIEAVKAYGLAYSTLNTTATELTIRLQDIRALLDRYGQPAQTDDGTVESLSYIKGLEDGIKAAQPAASAEPLCWTVLGTTYPRNWTHFGQDAERSAKLDARNLGDESRAVPLYPAPVAAQPSVPEGWKPVPVEPTQEMLDAGRIVDSRLLRTVGSIYDAMLAAAPTPPVADNIIITENGGVQLNVRNSDVTDKLFALIDQFRSARPAQQEGK